MRARIAAVVLIWILLGAGWVVLGGSVLQRTRQTDGRLAHDVARLWGSPQLQTSPALSFEWPVVKTVDEKVVDPATGHVEVVRVQHDASESHPVQLDGSALQVDLRLEPRRKGLLWYSTYTVDFSGTYHYTHVEERPGFLVIRHRFPTVDASYDAFRFEVDGHPDSRLAPLDDAEGRSVKQRIPVVPGQTVEFLVSYRSRGLDAWGYLFGAEVERVRGFRLTLNTDFDEIDFPDGAIAPSDKQATERGWRLDWRFDDLISGFRIGLELPRRLNPGPLAARISFFAPVSLGFFFVWIFTLTLLQRIELHPVNYLFLGAAFFAFHLLFAYLVDHVAVLPSFLGAAATSVFLVVSYLRLVVGLRFAAVEAGVSQLIYLVLFSYAHFFEGFTGLTVTVGSILTLFALMQLTGRIRWAERLGCMVLLAIAAGCRTPARLSPDPATVHWASYTNDVVGYAVEYPDTYQLCEHHGGADAQLRHGRHPSIVIHWVREGDGRSRGLWPKAAPLEPIQLGGRAGQRYVYDHYDGPFYMRVVSYVVEHRGRQLGLEFRTNREDLDPVQQHVLDSFRFL